MSATTTTPSPASSGEGSNPPPLLIVPPPTHRVVIDKTAKFVSLKGRQIEEEILSKPQAKNAASFTFLLEDHPFHAYYLAKVRELVENPNAALAQDPSSKALATQQQQQQQPAPAPEEAPITGETGGGRASMLNEAVKLASKRKHETPPPLEFLIPPPADATLPKVELIKLTAQFTATDGKKFETDLFHTQEHNPEFDFLHASHSQHTYYLELVKCYRRILDVKSSSSSSSSSLSWVTELAENEGVLLERAVHRLEFQRQEALKQMETEEKKAAERAAFLEIDWHDFVVVETIRFDEFQSSATSSSATTSAPATTYSEASRATADAVRRAVADDGAQDDVNIEVRADYRVEPVRATRNELMVTLPDGRRVPASEMNEHIKVELRDPKWREQQEKFEARQRDTNLVASSSVSQNLARMAWARPDVFGGELEEAERMMEEKKRREAEKVIWDGNALTADSVKSVVAAAAATAAFSVVPHYQQQQQQHTMAGLPPPYMMNVAAPPPPSFAPLPPPLPVSSVATIAPPPPPLPLQHQLHREDQADSKRMKLDSTAAQDDARQPQSGTLVYRVSVPPGGPANVSVGDLAIESSNQATLDAFKALVSVRLGNLPMSKFQLKTSGPAGRFLKNTDLLETVEDLHLEIKWKTR